MEPFQFPRPTVTYPCHTRGTPASDSRLLPEETPVALVYDGSTEAVMMATPADLEDFAIGFSITERLIEQPADIAELSVVHNEYGIELRMWLAATRATEYRQRRRTLTGPTGCGLCGMESLAEAVRPARRLDDEVSFAGAHIADAVAALEARQSLNRQTRATHAAGLYRPDSGDITVREDVGRHNALDKLAGAAARGGLSNWGLVVITSRVSVEMVQKTTAIGATVLVAVSAPTALAVRTADAANLTLVALARGSSYQVFSHPRRIR